MATSIAPDTTKVEAWITESSSAVVWGTHNTTVADETWSKFLSDTDQDSGEFAVDWDEASRLWASPEADASKEVWPEGWTSAEEKAGWTPVLVYSW
jgi:hypothetical protein